MDRRRKKRILAGTEPLQDRFDSRSLSTQSMYAATVKAGYLDTLDTHWAILFIMRSELPFGYVSRSRAVINGITANYTIVYLQWCP